MLVDELANVGVPLPVDQRHDGRGTRLGAEGAVLDPLLPLPLAGQVRDDVARIEHLDLEALGLQLELPNPTSAPIRQDTKGVSGPYPIALAHHIQRRLTAPIRRMLDLVLVHVGQTPEPARHEHHPLRRALQQQRLEGLGDHGGPDQVRLEGVAVRLEQRRAEGRDAGVVDEGVEAAVGERDGLGAVGD